MRGKVPSTASYSLGRGITPAYAGKRGGEYVVQVAGQDHPRVCGEKLRPGVIANSIKGSPPRMRGKVRQTAGDAQRVGITPAYAGKRRLRQLSSVAHQDHPRACGEKSVLLVWMT